MSITQDETRKLAQLAHIGIADDALPGLAGWLDAGLTFARQLNDADIDGIAPMTGVHPMRLKRRKDVIDDGNIADEVLANAPEARAGFFAVPKVVE